MGARRKVASRVRFQAVDAAASSTSGKPLAAAALGVCRHHIAYAGKRQTGVGAITIVQDVCKRSVEDTYTHDTVVPSRKPCLTRPCLL